MIKMTWIGAVCIAIFALGCSNGGDQSSSSTPNSTASSSGTPATGTTGASNATGYAAAQAIFTQKCIGCHGAGRPKGGINLTGYDSVMKGGDDGPIVTAGNPDKSKVIDALEGRNGAMQMPKGGAKLSDADIKTISDWIKAGAKNG